MICLQPTYILFIMSCFVNRGRIHTSTCRMICQPLTRLLNSRLYIFAWCMRTRPGHGQQVTAHSTSASFYCDQCKTSGEASIFKGPMYSSCGHKYIFPSSEFIHEVAYRLLHNLLRGSGQSNFCK